MPETTRRSALLARSKALRLRAETFKGRLKDARMKDWVTITVLHPLDDVDRFFLGDPESRPSEATWETMWVDSAENILGLAEKGFAAFEKQVASFGGPEKVVLVG